MKIYSKVNRLKGFLEYMIKKYEPICPFCGKKINWEDLYEKKYGNKESWTIHHKDFDHNNNDINNLILAHRSCHRSFHKQLDKKNLKKEV